MKRMMITLFAIGIAAMSSMSMAAMSTSKVRTETRFLTDKMAYELNLSTAQYNDAYEINYDFIYSIRYLMDDVMRGEGWAMDRYYYLLDIRNDDLRWVLSNYQYNRFLGIEYFYRPIYARGNKWQFRIYLTYTNHNHFYFAKPYHYKSYTGGHYRTHYNNVSYYKGRYNHKVHSAPVRIHNDRDNRVYNNTRRSDFKSVTVRPNSNTAPKRGKDDAYSNSSRRSNSSPANTNTNTTNRNNGNSNNKKNNTTAPSNSSGNSSSRRSTSTSSDNTRTVKPSTSTNRKATTNKESSDSSGSRRSSSSSSSSSRSGGSRR